MYRLSLIMRVSRQAKLKQKPVEKKYVVFPDGDPFSAVVLAQKDLYQIPRFTDKPVVYELGEQVTVEVKIEVVPKS